MEPLGATSAPLNLVLDDVKPHSSLSFGGGTYKTFRGLMILSPKTEKVKPLIAVEVFTGNKIELGNLKGAQLALLLGAVFAAGTALELADLGFGIDTDAYGSIFWITVVANCIALAYLYTSAGQAWLDKML